MNGEPLAWLVQGRPKMAFRSVAVLLRACVTEVFDFVLSGQYLVQKINQQILVRLRAEQGFEAKISKRVNIFVLECHETILWEQKYGK